MGINRNSKNPEHARGFLMLTRTNKTKKKAPKKTGLVVSDEENAAQSRRPPPWIAITRRKRKMNKLM